MQRPDGQATAPSALLPTSLINLIFRVAFRVNPRQDILESKHPMSQTNSQKDYYEILGANERTSPRDLERLYKRMAARRHPDKGGTEEE